jgi:hypothetical protein
MQPEGAISPITGSSEKRSRSGRDPRPLLAMLGVALLGIGSVDGLFILAELERGPPRTSFLIFTLLSFSYGVSYIVSSIPSVNWGPVGTCAVVAIVLSNIAYWSYLMICLAITVPGNLAHPYAVVAIILILAMMKCLFVVCRSLSSV